jgi:hypothetical protein
VLRRENSREESSQLKRRCSMSKVSQNVFSEF